MVTVYSLFYHKPTEFYTEIIIIIIIIIVIIIIII
jgi:hypothetical protein